MTCNVFGGTLNLTQSINQSCWRDKIMPVYESKPSHTRYLKGHQMIRVMEENHV